MNLVDALGLSDGPSLLDELSANPGDLGAKADRGNFAGKGSYMPVIGDMSPFVPGPFRIKAVPHSLVSNPATSRQPGAQSIYRMAGIKIADNQTPAPQDRVFYSFNYFNNVNKSLNQYLGGQISGVNVYHNLFGFEKTVFDGQASVGIRLPLNNIDFQTTRQGYSHHSTSIGDVSVYFKSILVQDARSGSLLSAGLDVRTPTGPSGFAGSPLFRSAHPASLQPFLGYYLAFGRGFVQGFTSVEVPTAPRSASTVLYNDFSLGYYAYRAEEPDRFLSAVIPVFEVHVNTPLNYIGDSLVSAKGTPSLADPRGVPDVVDLTFGTHFRFGDRSLLTVSYVDPVTGPRPFSGEFALLFNYFYGGKPATRRPIVPSI